METAFAHPHCPASYPHSTPSITPSAIPVDNALPRLHNDALVYLALAVASFCAVPSLIWLRDKRHKARERRRNRAVVESLKAKMEANRALEAAAAAKLPASVPISVTPEASLVDEQEDQDVEEAKEKKKRSKDRRKRGRDREPSRSVRSKKSLPSSRPPVQRVERGQQETEYTPKAPEQSRFTHGPDECYIAPPSMPNDPCTVPPMPDIASPTPLSIIPTAFDPPSPSPSPPQTRSETSSHPGPSRSASASPTPAPVTPPSLPASHSFPPIVSVKTIDAEPWVAQLPSVPRDDPAWDWDGQSSTYSASSPSRAPSSLGSHQPSKQQRSKPAVPLSRAAVSSPASPSMVPAPSLVFPSLNAHPPPGASLVTQIASLKGALEASRMREEKHRRDAERWSKECDLIKWRWNEAGDIWRRREVELQAQMHSLVHQLQTLTHAMQAASLSPPVAPFMSGPGQSPFPHAMSFPSPFGMGIPQSQSPATDTLNEGLAEAILKRPGKIRSATASSSRSGMRRGGSGDEEQRGTSQATHEVEQQPPKLKKTENDEEVIEFEFPTLLERRVTSPRDRETVSRVDGVEIFS